MPSRTLKEQLEPLTLEEAEAAYQGFTQKLVRAAYLRSFTPYQASRCKAKFQQFKMWWKTLSERQQERVKGAMAAEVLHVFRE